MSAAQPITWQTANGSVRVLPERGRVLDIVTGGHSALWRPEPPPFPWCLGGERLWFGPEADWNWLKLGTPDFANYEVPPALNPDLWTVTETRDGFFSSTLEIELRCPHRDAFVKLRVSRSVEWLPPELFAEPAPGVGLRTSTEMEILGGTSGQPVDFWSLLQVPLGGRMIVPSCGRAAPRDYFAPTPAGDISVHSTHVEIAMRGAAAFKLGVAPSHATGRIAYARPLANGHLVLVRSFPVHPELRYCDSPMHASGAQGDALQFYCDDRKIGPFGEMEHRTPAIVCGAGPQRLAETAITRVMLLDAAAFGAWKKEFTGT